MVSWRAPGAPGVPPFTEWLISATYFPEVPVDEGSVTRYTNERLELQVEREGTNGLIRIAYTCKIGCFLPCFMGIV